MCPYIYFDSVFVSNGQVLGNKENTSWAVFKEIMKTFTQTQGGIAFDINYASAVAVRTVGAVLKNLATGNRLLHYGILNIHTWANQLHALMITAKDVLRELKNIQANDPARRTVIAFGLYDYNEQGALTEYKQLFFEAVNTFTGDTVIARSSVNRMVDDANCQVVPPTTITPISPVYPGLEQYRDLLTTDTVYQNSEVSVGVSIEMAALLYMLPQGEPELLNYDTPRRCDAFGVVSPDSVCDVDLDQDATDPHGVIQAGPRDHAFFMDTVNSVEKKVRFISEGFQNHPVHDRTSWLVFNVHFDIDLGPCGSATSFPRLRKLKETWGIP